MQQKYRQEKERKKAGEEERGAGKRPGEIGKMIIQAGKRGRARHGQKGWKRKVGK